MTEMKLPPQGNFLATSEAMAQGHPDKVADQVAEAIIDAMLEQDSDSSVACEVVIKTSMIMIFGSARTNATIDFDKVVRGAVKQIGYDSADMGLDYKNAEVFNRLDISKRGQDQGQNFAPGLCAAPEDGGCFVGYATNETPEKVSLSHQLATQLCESLANVQKSRSAPLGLRPDGKAQVTLEYSAAQDGSLRPVRVHTVVLSVQHHPDVTTDRLRSEVIKHVIKPVMPANMLDGESQLLVNPAGRFVIGGPRGDAGVSGRQGVADSHGAWASHGGGSFVGKNGTKVERYGTYAARWVAKSLVMAGYAGRCSVKLAYRSGKSDPSVTVDSFGSVKSGMTDSELCDVVKQHFDLTPGALVRDLHLRKPQYHKYSVFGYCGRHDPTPQWEKCRSLSGSGMQAGLWQ